MSSRKRLRSMKLSDEHWEMLGSFAQEQGVSRTEVIEQFIETYIPEQYRPIQELPLGQSSMFDFVEED